MKPAIVTSSVLHAAILSWGLWHFGQPTPLDMGAEALPVSLVPIEEFSQATIGEKTAPVRDKPAPTPTKTPERTETQAVNAGDNSVDLDSAPQPKAAPRETVKTAAATTPPPPPPPAKAPEPTPQPPEPKPEPVTEPQPAEPTPPAEPQTEIDELAAEQTQTQPAEPAPPRNVPVPQVKPKPPEPVKVAEAKPTPEPTPEEQKTPEPVKTAEKTPEKPKTPQKPKETKKPTQQASDEKEFDADEIAALLNKQDSAGGGAKRSTEQASLGAQKATGGTLSASEMDALRGQISRCWSPPAGAAEAGSFRVSISMQLDQSGELTGMPKIVSGGGSSMAERAASDAAVRAVRRCAPYNLPAEKYDTWAEVTVNFDPSQMF